MASGGHGCVSDPYEASVVPLWQTSTFCFEDPTHAPEYDYTRSGNPTRTALEHQLVALEGCRGSLSFVTGMAAVSTAVGLVPAGGLVVAGLDIYGGTSRYLDRVLPELGVESANVDLSDAAAVAAALDGARAAGRPAMLLLESPTNPRLDVLDLRSLAALAKARGALVAVDGSVMTPAVQRPLELGADVAIYSATKHLSGHSDVTAGVLSANDDEILRKLAFRRNAQGTALPPFECWLFLRGLKTLELRLARAGDNADAIARLLDAHPLVRSVRYPGLESHPNHDVQMAQTLALAGEKTRGGTLVSFTTGDVRLSRAVVMALERFSCAVSFGGTGSYASLPCYMSHASIPKEIREARGLPDDLVRISPGIENTQDLLDDLTRAFDIAAKQIQEEDEKAKEAEKQQRVA